MLHDVAKRKAASGQLASHDGLGASIVWVVAGLCGTIYPTLLAECWPMLSLLLGDGLLRESLIGSSASAAPPKKLQGARRDAYRGGLLQLLLNGLHAVGWWGPPSPAAGADQPIVGEPTAVHRHHLLPGAMEREVVTALRHACYIQASTILPSMGTGALPVGDSIGAGSSSAATPLLEALMLLLPAMYLQVKSDTGLTEAQRIGYEPLIAADEPAVALQAA